MLLKKCKGMPPLAYYVYHKANEIPVSLLNSVSVSSAADYLRRRKYSLLVTDFEIAPVAVETSGISRMLHLNCCRPSHFEGHQ